MKNLILLFICCFAINVLAQSPRFTLYAGPNYSINSAQSTFLETQTIVDFDTLGFTSIAVRRETGYVLTNQPGINVHGSVHFPINSEVSLVTGLQLSWNRFKIRPEFLGFSDIEGADTIFTPRPMVVIGEPEPVQTCQTFDSSNFDELDENIKIQIIYLTIPINLEFSLSKEFSVQAGGYISTPIFTRVSLDFFEFLREQRTDENGNPITHCFSELNTDINTTGNGFNNLIAGLNLGLFYQLNDRIAISAYLSKPLNNVFVNQNDQEFFFRSPPLVAQINTYNASIGLRYSFGIKKEKTE